MDAQAAPNCGNCEKERLAQSSCPAARPNVGEGDRQISEPEDRLDYVFLNCEILPKRGRRDRCCPSRMQQSRCWPARDCACGIHSDKKRCLVKRALLFLGYLLACLPAEAQNTGLEGQTLQPQWGDGFAPIPQGTHIWQVKNDSGQTWTLHGVSFYTDTGTSQLVSVHDDMNREFLVSPVTGSLAYAAGQLAAGATLGYGHSLTIKATFDGTTTLGQADIAVTHPQVDGTESAAISNISTVSPVGPFTGCGFQSSASGVAQISCTPSVQLTAGSVSFVYVVNGYGTATPTLQDNGTTVSPFPGYPKVAAGNSSVTLFVIPNESAGTHTPSRRATGLPCIQLSSHSTQRGPLFRRPSTAVRQLTFSQSPVRETSRAMLLRPQQRTSLC